jgi:hypothetical protein
VATANVVGTAISTLGALLGILLKDYFFSRSFERWKQRQTLESIYQKYRDPLRLSARELASRTSGIVEHYPTVYLTTEALASRPERQIENSIDDPYFRRYKLLSTVYRICAFLGWIEPYRREITYLNSGRNTHSRELERAVELVRSDLADGQLNNAPDWDEWRDTLVFREELRAIGESMLELRGTVRTVIGYGKFVEQFDAADPSPTQRWAWVVSNFVLGLETKRPDFRKVRLQRLVVHLVRLMELLDEASIEDNLVTARDKWAKQHNI